MELHKIAIRALFTFGFLLVAIRATGLRTVGQASAQSFVAALILGDLVDDLLWADVSAARFAVAAGTICGLEFLVSMWTGRSRRASRVLENAPAILVRDGCPQHPALRREKISIWQLEGLIRHRGMEPQRWSEIQSAWLEPNGEIGLVLKEWARRVPKQDEVHLRKDRR